MKRASLANMTVESLVARFAEIGLAQDKARLYDEHTKYNSLYDQMSAVVDELRRRKPDARPNLATLFDHSNIHVRVRAAARLMAVSPVRARKVLEEIAASKDFPEAGDAGMLLNGLEDGTWKPT